MSRARHPPPEQLTPLIHGGTFLPVVLKEQRFLGYRQPFPHDVGYLSAPHPDRRREDLLSMNKGTKRRIYSFPLNGFFLFRTHLEAPEWRSRSTKSW